MANYLKVPMMELSFKQSYSMKNIFKKNFQTFREKFCKISKVVWEDTVSMLCRTPRSGCCDFFRIAILIDNGRFAAFMNILVWI